MPTRHIYLRIESIEDYSPVEPDDKALAPIQYMRDGMRNLGHLDGTIPQAERDARALRAVVYREYLDPDYLVPKTTKIVQADVNEPLWDRRVPGTVIWAHAGETLKIHVFNADDRPHSFHVHGVAYGIDSDGAWPMGTQSADGRRSDEICPGRHWTYTFEASEETIGAWPFHDHSSHGARGSQNRGLFGAIIVRKRRFKWPIPIPLPDRFDDLLRARLPRPAPGPLPLRERLGPIRERLLLDHHELLREWLLRAQKLFPWPWPWPPLDYRLHVPVFFHQMRNDEAKPLFDSGDLEENGAGVFSHTFADVGSYGYFCAFHPMMTGTVEVVVGGPAAASVNILDAPAMGFYPDTIQIAPGGTVTWTNLSFQHHTVTSNQGASMPTHCINGRGFVGNSPTIVARSGQTIVWYVFNLDFGHEWHNFHPHDQRWHLAGENLDVRSMGPAESFSVQTRAPDVLLLDAALEATQKDPPPNATKHRLMGDFIFHCHVHHHLTNGMVGVVRSYQDVWLTPEQETYVFEELGIPTYDPSNPIPDVEIDRCNKAGPGSWEELALDPEVTFMHACLLPETDKVLYWGYTQADQSRLYDHAGPAVTAPVNQPADLPGMDPNLSDLWSAGHSFLADGRPVAHGGFAGVSPNWVNSFVFDPGTEQWSQTDSTDDPRFYATTITLANGRLMTLYGSASKSLEIYDPAADDWGAPIAMPAAMNHHVYYPWTQLLPDGRLFIAGPHDPTHRFEWNPVGNVEAFPMISGNRSTGGEKGTSFLLTLRPPDYRPRVVVAGGNPVAARKTAEMIDLADPTPAWASLPDLNEERAQQVNSVLLPDGRVVVAGGAGVAGNGGPAEILDGNDPMAGWELGPVMTYHRGYHSAAILLTDGSVLFGGDPNSGVFERYKPGYFDLPRPTIAAVTPNSVAYGATFGVDSPEAAEIAEIVVMRPGGVTHGFNMTQRAVECAITGVAGNTIQVEAPPHGNVAPPGWYLLFVLDGNRIPSLGHWIRIGP